ncbi:MAG: hypothetical protein WBV06_06255 [Acidimicrobiia bacterium]
MAIAGVALIVVAIVSWQALHLSPSDLRWGALVASGILVPVSVGLTAAEYRLVAAASGVGANWTESLRITVLGTLANLLPLPGAAALRVNDLVSRAAGARRAAAATIGIGVLWLAWALIVSGLALCFAGSIAVGMAMVVAGLAAMAAAVLIGPRRAARHSRGFWLAMGSGIEIASLATGVARILLTMAALGLDPTVIQAVGLVAAGAIASTVGIVPGGLGVRELVAGVLAPLVGLEVAAAIVTVAIVRVVGLVFSAPIAVLVMRTSR